ncbi:MAG: hypothetical protein ACLRMJ_02990 [Alistipes finegoldii]
MAIEEEGDPSRSARFTMTGRKLRIRSIPLRFAFNYVGTEWLAALSPSASHRLRVKAGAADPIRRGRTTLRAP